MHLYSLGKDWILSGNTVQSSDSSMGMSRFVFSDCCDTSRLRIGETLRCDNDLFYLLIEIKVFDLQRVLQESEYGSSYQHK